MRAMDLMRECFLGGPGLDGYAWHADTYCANCARRLFRKKVVDIAPGIRDTEDPAFSDSAVVPQPIFFGESTLPEACAICGTYLYGDREEAGEDSDE